MRRAPRRWSTRTNRALAARVTDEQNPGADCLTRKSDMKPWLRRRGLRQGPPRRRFLRPVQTAPLFILGGNFLVSFGDLSVGRLVRRAVRHRCRSLVPCLGSFTVV